MEHIKMFWFKNKATFSKWEYYSNNLTCKITLKGKKSICCCPLLHSLLGSK